ncbi:DNA cytosine methyltransferase [Shouchella clausii]|uniref:DNA cytosine methyltransferase n=1 Tax=Shouchella clausii TaxID=79880 RepID=UPI0026F42053|nr:DNA cytosine methyltransferase [Shouchella clausii]MDO7284686.1 DNA cytosine methyltransferase [Shouchella clausii]MDO7304781.1 DNA cytosine methyltransferase [Shouchella clausii]
MKPLAIDLFCGAGGMSEGILQAGFHIIYSSDINGDVKKTYLNRHEQLGLYHGVNTYYEQADIRELPSSKIMESIAGIEIFSGGEVPTIDAIFGGPPCQGFSRAGLRRKDDPRNTLFKEYLRIVNDIRPRYVVMENVVGFNDTKLDGYVGVTGCKYKEGTLIPHILHEEFKKIGYNTLDHKILDASDFGVPQKRKRVIFIAYLDGEIKPKYPEAKINEEDKVTVYEALSDLLLSDKKHSESLSDYQLASRLGRTKTLDGDTLPSNGHIYNHEFASHSAAIKERFSLFNEGETCSMVKNRIKETGINLITYPALLNYCVKKLNGKYNHQTLIDKFLVGDVDEDLLSLLLTKKNNRFKLCKHKPSPTVVTLPDDYLVPIENRIPTVREMARLQSFDDSFIFLGKRTTGGERRKHEVPQYTQVGNAVPPLLAKAIAEEIFIALKKPCRKDNKLVRSI